MMDVSVIVVNFNTKLLTEQCLNSIFEKTFGLEFEVILVDNGSTDGSCELFSRDSRITYIYNKENLGFGRANNLGASYAKGDYLFFLNSDTYLRNNAIFLLWQQMHHFPDRERVACAGCMLLSPERDIVHSYAKFPSPIRSILEATLYPVLWKMHFLQELPSTSNYQYEQKEGAYFDVDYITGADLMISRKATEELGLFDSGFFMYYEETELQYRFMRHNLRRIICRGPEIVHLEGKSNKRQSPDRTTMVIRSMFLYYQKTTSRLFYLTFAMIFKSLYVFVYMLAFPFINGSHSEKLAHVRDLLRIKYLS